jgi:hypothetical protein
MLVRVYLGEKIEMPLLLDQITRKKLVLVKQLYQRAVIESKSLLSKINRIISVIEFDLAIETTLKAIVSSLDTTKTPESDVNKLLDQANVLLKSSGLGFIPDEAHIKHVRRIRNNAQHQAIYPNESEVNDCRTYTRDFIDNVVKQVWDVNFESISLVDLIEDIKIKKLLLDAFERFEQGDYSNTIDLASEGMTRTLEYAEHAVVGRFPSFVRGIVVTEGFSQGRDNQLIRDPRHAHDEEELLKSIKKMRETLLYLALEMNFSELVEYRKIVGHTWFTLDEKHHRQGGKDSINQDDAEYILSYSTNTIIRIEERLGSLSKPYTN